MLSGRIGVWEKGQRNQLRLSAPIVVSFAYLITNMVPTWVRTTAIEQKGFKGVSLLVAWLVSPTARYMLKTSITNRFPFAVNAYNSLRTGDKTCLRMSKGRLSPRKQCWTLSVALGIVQTSPYLGDRVLRPRSIAKC